MACDRIGQSFAIAAGRMRDDRGFSMPELLVSTMLLLVVTSTVTSALLQMTNSQKTIWNRTEMHSGVRSATELMQQEVGQAGRIVLPAPVTLQTAVVPNVNPVTVTVSSAASMFVGEQLTIDTGGAASDAQETVMATAVNTGSNQLTAVFTKAHAAGAPIAVYGGFANGIVPTNVTNGSTGTALKMFGDINGDGNMVYVEYTCDTATGYLYRNMMALDAAGKPAVGPAQVLLSNIQPNPGGTDCFTYQQQAVTTSVSTLTYVTDVAITLTVQTQQKDSITNSYQTETKALLNVSPRNVFDVWQLASLNITERIQPTPSSVTALLP